MIDVKEAARVAAEYFADLYSSADPDSLRLEEVELAEDEQYWMITLSFRESVEERQWLSNDTSRQYKVFKIDAETGKVISMKIRQLEGA